MLVRYDVIESFVSTVTVALLWLIRLLLSNLLTQNKRPTDQIYRDMLQVVADRRQQRQRTD